MKKWTWLILLAVCATPSFSQLLTPRDPAESFGRDLFGHRIYNFADLPDRKLSIAEFHFALFNDLLNFFKTPAGDYVARYDLELIIYKDKKENVAYRLISDTVRVEAFAATNDRLHAIRKSVRFPLPPGDYHYRVQLFDSEQQPVLIREERLKLADFSTDQMQISDVVFADKIDYDKGTYVPNLRSSFSDDKSDFAVYFEVYPPQRADSVYIEYTVLDAMGATLLQQRRSHVNLPSLAFCLSLRDQIKKPGEYFFNIETRAGKRMVKSQQKFTVLWGNLALQKSNLELAIEQLGLIAKSSFIRQLRDADAENREKMYAEFWRQRDPTPGTPANELRDVFFERIDYANRNFAEPMMTREGWHSDRGRIYIQNGPPDQIDRQPAEPGMPAVETWAYSQLNRRYIFADRQGNGEYRLVKVE
jgi:GWxTD domain-containing protein